MIAEMKRLKRELKYQGTILDVYQDTMQFASGKTEKWDFISHRLHAAAVLPVLSDGRILLVRQYRPALDRETLEIPAGCKKDPSEDPMVTAARELEEECGLRCQNIRFLLSLRTTVAFCDEQVKIYLAQDLLAGEKHWDDSESIEAEYYTHRQLCDMVFSGQIEDSKTVAAIMAYGNLLSAERES